MTDLTIRECSCGKFEILKNGHLIHVADNYKAAERDLLLMRRHERVVANAPDILSDPYKYGGRGSVLEADLAKALIRERTERLKEASERGDVA